MNTKENIKNYIENSLNYIDKNKDSGSSTEETTLKNKALLLFTILDFLFKISKEIQELTFSTFENSPEIYADIVSSASNPNCSCRGRVVNYISKNLEKAKENLFSIIDKEIFENDYLNGLFIKINAQVNSNNENQNNVQKNKYIGGNVYEIDNTPESYFSFIHTLKSQNLIFKGLSVIEINNKYKIFVY
jgi:hypothetical protein